MNAARALRFISNDAEAAVLIVASRRTIAAAMVHSGGRNEKGGRVLSGEQVVRQLNCEKEQYALVTSFPPSMIRSIVGLDHTTWHAISCFYVLIEAVVGSPWVCRSPRYM